MTYHNTTNLSGNELTDAVNKAANQDNIVLGFFRDHKNKHYAPSEIWKNCFTVKTPLTSIRRSINTLTRKGLLVRTAIQQKGIYGRPERLWKVAA